MLKKIADTSCEKELYRMQCKLKSAAAIKQRADGSIKTLQTYESGKPCKNGHISPRYKSNRSCVECGRAQALRWNNNNKDVVAERTAKWEAENKEKRTKSFKAYRESARDELNALRAIWDKKNPEKARSLRQNRRARVAGAEGSHTSEDILRIKALQKSKCAGCLKKLSDTKYHVDHIVPLSKSGRNSPENLQILCQHCNLSKGPKDPLEWNKGKGLLI